MKRHWGAILNRFITPARSESKRAAEAHSWQEDIREAEEQHRRAFLANDLATLRDMFSDQFMVNSPLNNVLGKSQLLDMIQGGKLTLSSFDQRIEAMQRFGDLVIVMGEDQVTFAPPAPNAGQSHTRRFTDVWQWETGRWRFAARQASIVPQNLR